MRKASFPPVVDERTRVLVLGSLPGEESLRLRQYYANPRNGFWPLMEAVLEAPLVGLQYLDRLAALLRRGIGLWDVVAEARRTGSLDTAITDATPNDVAALTSGLPNLRAVAFNGGKAAAIGVRQLGGSALTILRLPSSSPAYTVTFEQKAAAWAALRPFLAAAP